MQLVVIQSAETQGGGGLAVSVMEEDLWALQVLCARAGQPILSIRNELEAINDTIEALQQRSGYLAQLERAGSLR